MNDRRVKITGEVDVKHDQLAAMRKELEDFKAGWKQGGAEADKTEKQVDEVAEATKKASVAANVWKGIWQGVGQGLFNSVLNGLKGLVGGLTDGIAEASRFDAIFDKMAVRGVGNIEDLRVATVELAGALGKSWVEIADSIDLAEKLGAGSSALSVAQAAWENYAVTGADVNKTIQVSSRLIKAFNLDVRDQAKLINDVSQSSQRARIDQDMLWQAMSMMGPMMKNLNANYQDLLRATEIGVSRGLKAEEEGLSGFREMLSQLISPSDEFSKNLVEMNLIQSASSEQWRKLTSEVEAQKKEFEALNAQIKDYERQAQAIGLLTSESERRIKQYEELTQKQQAGQRLTGTERRDLIELKRELREYNKELSTYDKLGGLVADRDFRRSDITHQLRERIKSAAEAQAELAEKTNRAKYEADGLGNSLDAAEAKLSPLEASLRQEIPAAIKEAIGEQGFGAFIQKLSEMPSVMEPLTAEVKTLVTTIGPGLQALVDDANASGTAITNLAGQFSILNQGATDGMSRLAATLGTMKGMILAPIADVGNSIANLLLKKINEPFEDNSTLMGKIQTWAINTGATMMADIDMVLNGDMKLGEMLSQWFDTAMKFAQGLWETYAEPLVTKLISGFEAQAPAMRSFLEKMFSEMGTAAWNAFWSKVGNVLGEGGVGKAFDWGFEQLYTVDRAMGFEPSPGQMTGRRSAAPASVAPVSSSSFSMTNHITGSDPGAIADEIERRQRRANRLGHTGRRN